MYFEVVFKETAILKLTLPACRPAQAKEEEEEDDDEEEEGEEEEEEKKEEEEEEEKKDEEEEEALRHVNVHPSVRDEDCVGIEFDRLDQGHEIVDRLFTDGIPLPPLPVRLPKRRCQSSEDDRFMSDRSTSSEEEKEATRPAPPPTTPPSSGAALPT